MRIRQRAGYAAGAALAAALFAGCSNLAPHSRLAQPAVADLPSSTPPTETASASPPGPIAQLPTLEYGLGGAAPGTSSDAELENRPGLEWVKTSADETAPPPARAAAGNENPLSWEYWKLVGRDIVATVTAPAHWDTRDWLVFGGVTAAIGTVAVFDEDIQRAVQRNRNGTVDQFQRRPSLAPAVWYTEPSEQAINPRLRQALCERPPLLSAATCEPGKAFAGRFPSDGHIPTKVPFGGEHGIQQPTD